MTNEANNTTNQTTVTTEQYMKSRGLADSKLNDMSKEELILFIDQLTEEFGEVMGCAEEAVAAYWLYDDIRNAPVGMFSDRRKDNIKHACWHLYEKIKNTQLQAQHRVDELIDLCHPTMRQKAETETF